MPVSTPRRAAVAASCGDKCVVVGTIFFATDDDELAEVFNAGEALRNAVEQIESSSDDEAEIRYDGLKYLPSRIY